MDWSTLYPHYASPNDPEQPSTDDAAVASRKPTPLTQNVEVVDIGCGFGGLLVGLAPVLPDNMILGMPSKK